MRFWVYAIGTVLTSGCNGSSPVADGPRLDRPDSQLAREATAPDRVQLDRPRADAPRPPLVVWLPEKTCPPQMKAVGRGIDCAAKAIVSPGPDLACWNGTPQAVYVGCTSASVAAIVGDTIAACAASVERLVGGGCACASSFDLYLSAPTAGDSWRCSCGTQATATAYCAPAGVLGSRGLRPLDKAGAANETSVVCDVGEEAVSGGCEASFGMSASMPLLSGATATGWRCVGVQSGGNLVARVICAK